MKKNKKKFTNKWAKDITWTMCPHCGHAVHGVTTMDINLPIPKVKDIKKKKAMGFKSC